METVQLVAAHLVVRALCGALLCASITVSDGIEFFTNKKVHRVHNCPAIRGIRWEQYDCFQAAYTGFVCSWWLVGVAMLLPTYPPVYGLMTIFNVCLPLVLYVFQGPDPKDYFLGHRMLYGWNTIALGIASIWRVVIFAAPLLRSAAAVAYAHLW